MIAFTLPLSAKEYDVTSFGAVGNGRTNCTVFIQEAVDSCAAQGGGRVVVPAGEYLTGTIFLRSKVDLYLEQGAILSGSTDYADYPDLATERKGLVHADHIENASVSGYGTINANGAKRAFFGGNDHPLRPHCVLFLHCRKMNIRDVTLLNSANWTFRIFDCDEVFVSGLKIYSHANFNNDGIDIDARNVVVTNCIIDATDDGICLKSEMPGRLCENIAITNCVVASNCNAIKFGTASVAGFKNVSISNCVIKTPAENDLFSYKAHMVPGVTAPIVNNSGLAIEMVDGGVLEKISITNITMQDVLTPIFIRLGHRRSDKVQYLKDIVISNIIANSESRMTSSINGIPGYLAENISISNVVINCTGGGLKEHTQIKIPEQEGLYPENKMFGPTMPSYGFYIRHVKNISLNNVVFNLGYKDERFALYLEDAENVRLDHIKSDDHVSDQPIIKMVNVSNATISGYDSPQNVPLFLRVEGDQSSRIKLLGNDFSTAGKIFELGDHVKQSAVTKMYNIE